MLVGLPRMRFDAILVWGEWGPVDSEGFDMPADARARVAGVFFMVCTVEADRIAIINGAEVQAEARALVMRYRPEWLAAIAFVDVVRVDGELVLDVDATPDANSTRCAVAAVCVAIGTSGIAVDSGGYRVRVRDSGDVRVMIEQDRETQLWRADVTAS